MIPNPGIGQPSFVHTVGHHVSTKGRLAWAGYAQVCSPDLSNSLLTGVNRVVHSSLMIVGPDIVETYREILRFHHRCTA